MLRHSRSGSSTRREWKLFLLGALAAAAGSWLLRSVLSPGEEERERRVDSPRWLEGHQVELVCNGAVFDAMEALISQARSSINLGMYIWRPGEASERISRALLERARAGVRCRILVDAVGSRGGFRGEVCRRLEAGGCQVRRFHPLRGSSPRDMLLRNHRKLLVVDGRLGLTGGWCIADKWLGDGLHEDGWRDTNVRVRGPVVGQMQAAFDKDWQRVGEAPLPPGDFPPLVAEGPMRAAFVASRAGRGTEPAERRVRQLIGAARHRLWIASGYFVLDRALTRLLVSRRRAGVDVRILVPGDINDIPWAPPAQRSCYRPLLAGGVRLWEYQPAMMHSKFMVVDDALSAVGSINLDPFALNVLEECTLLVEDPGFTEALARAFLQDLTHAREVHEAPWRHALLAGPRHALWRALRHLQ